MIRRLRPAVLLSALTVAALVAASPGAASRRSASAGTFTILVMTGINTAINNNPTLPDTVQVAADHINAQGGLGGSQIKIETCNTLGTAVGQAACARQAVSDHVDDVFTYGQFTAASTPILAAAHIPQIGSFLQNPADYQQPDFISIAPGSAAVFGCVPFVLKQHGVKVVSTLMLDVSITYYLNTILKVATKAAGLKYVGPVAVPLTTTDYTPYVAKVGQLGASGIGLGIPIPPTLGVIRAEQSLGVNEINVTTSSATTDADLAPFGGLENGHLFGCSLVPPPSATNLPAIKMYNAQMDAAGVGGKGFNTIQAWLSIYAMKAVSKAVKGPVTGSSLLAAAHKARNVNILGLYKWSPAARGPAAFPNAASGNLWFTKAVNGQWVLDGSGKPFDVWKAMRIARS